MKQWNLKRNDKRNDNDIYMTFCIWQKWMNNDDDNGNETFWKMKMTLKLPKYEWIKMTCDETWHSKMKWDNDYEWLNMKMTIKQMKIWMNNDGHWTDILWHFVINEKKTILGKNIWIWMMTYDIYWKLQHKTWHIKKMINENDRTSK